MHVLPGLLSLILFSGWEREAWEQGVKEEANFLIAGFVLLWRINVRLWSIAELLIFTISLQKLKLIESVMWSTASSKNPKKLYPYGLGVTVGGGSIFFVLG